MKLFMFHNKKDNIWLEVLASDDASTTLNCDGQWQIKAKWSNEVTSSITRMTKLYGIRGDEIRGDMLMEAVVYNNTIQGKPCIRAEVERVRHGENETIERVDEEEGATTIRDHVEAVHEARRHQGANDSVCKALIYLLGKVRP